MNPGGGAQLATWQHIILCAAYYTMYCIFREIFACAVPLPWVSQAMTEEFRNKQQAAVDAVVRAARQRQRLVELAERAKIVPESLSFDEIKSMSDFVLVHADCWDKLKSS